jgi:hypothetical protein
MRPTTALARYHTAVSALALLLAVTVATAGCGGAAKAQKRAYKAEAAVAKERLRLIDDYQDCMRKAGADPLRQDGCETFLKAAEALD